MIKILSKRWVYHSVIWIACYLGLTSIDYITTGKTIVDSLKEPFLFVLPVMIITYLAFWAKETLFNSRKYLLYILAFIAIIFVGVFIYESLEFLKEGRGNSRTQNVINFSILQIFALGLQFFKRGITNQYQLQELKAKTAITELNALKAQVNPHFLFNTLNNIYGMNQINPEKGSEMIMELSDVMRYHLEFSKVGKVKLEDEIQLLESYIKLEILRLNDTCDLQIDFENVNENILISPLLFIPFVENAFKHGTHPTQACFVHIKLSSDKNKIMFTVKNSLIENRKVVKTNIGIQNTRRRLELLFPDKHELNISKDASTHLVELNIEL